MSSCAATRSHGHTGDGLNGKLDSLALGPPIGNGSSGRAAQRESTVQSASDAGDIFDLYRSGRDSSAASSLRHRDATSPHDRTPAELTTASRPLSNGALQSGSQPAHQDMELLADESSPHRGSDISAWSGRGDRSSAFTASGQDNPQITVTPDMTPSKRDAVVTGSTSGGRSTRPGSLVSTMPSTAANTPTHPSIRRLSARPSTGSRTSANDSQISFGSSQYPGEEADAFHVRSTYARLESEGVYGDGWDQGVERTRGGPGGSSGQRATMLFPDRGHLGPRERDYLSSLDRYGFVDEPLRDRSESRLVLIPSAPLAKVPKLPKTSPLAGKARDQPTSSFRAPTSEPPGPRVPDSRHEHTAGTTRSAKEDERVSKWMGMMTVKKRDEGGNTVQWGWRKGGADDKTLKRVYKGIPDRWRMAAWWTMVGQMAGEPSASGKGKKRAESLAQEFRDGIDLPSTYDVQIDLDVPRTISGHTMFVTRYGSGQRSLFRVLHCYSMTCEVCGYVQGMGPIAATLLCYFDPERVYTMLVRLHDHYGMHSVLTPGFPGLLEAFYVQERLLEWLMPDVFQSFSRNMISSTSWGTKWYITLFVNTVPFSQQLRIWDAFLLDGPDVIIMVTIAILWSVKDLLGHPAANFESILSLLSSYFVAEDEDQLMSWVRRMLHQNGMRERMTSWRKEWSGLVAAGQTAGVLL